MIRRTNAEQPTPERGLFYKTTKLTGPVVFVALVVLIGLACDRSAACAKSATDQRTFTAAESAADDRAACSTDQRAATGPDAMTVIRPAIAVSVVVAGTVVAAVMVVLC